MKVVILCGYCASKKGNGACENINKLTQHVSQVKNVELHVVTFGDRNAEIKKGNLNVHLLKGIKPKILLPILIPRLKRKIEEINPDIVHGITTLIPYSTAVAFLRNKPTLLTVFGIVGKEIKYAERMTTFILKLGNALNERFVISRIPNIVVVASSTKELINEWTKSKIYTVQDGIEFEEIQESYPYKNEETDVLFMSHLTRLKGVDVLIKAVPIIVNLIPDFTLHIAGEGPQKSKLKKLVKKLNVENHVKFLGHVKKEEKYSYYKACKIAVGPSRWDCQPYVITEGAACGKPTIVSDKTNPPSFYDKKMGLVFQSENSQDLADKIVKILKDDRLREEMGKRGLDEVRKFDWKKISERYVKIYREIIEDFSEKKV